MSSSGLPESALIAIFVVVLVLASVIVALAVIFRRRGEIRRWQSRPVRRPNQVTRAASSRQQGLSLEEIAKYCPLFEYKSTEETLKAFDKIDRLPQDSWWKQEAEKIDRKNRNEFSESEQISDIDRTYSTSTESAFQSVSKPEARLSESDKSDWNQKPAKHFFRDGICAICLEEVLSNSYIRIILRCRHGFHSHCITHWLLSANRCPLCNVSCVVKEQPSQCAVDESQVVVHQENVGPSENRTPNTAAAAV
eukprot:jgi/Galph1/3540/GphlegSOOS_G2211.1